MRTSRLWTPTDDLVTFGRMLPLLLWIFASSGLAGLAFHPVYTWVTEVAYGRLFPALGAGSTVTVVQWGLAAALILPQSILLGMTFPLLSAAVLRRATTAASTGRTIALLKTGNPERAATIFYRRYRNAMSSSDFRMRLLDAHVQRSLAQRR